MVIFQVNHNSTFKRNWLRQQNCPKLTRFSHWPKLKIHIALVKTAWFPSWSLTLHWVVPAAVFPVVVLLEAPDVQQHMGSYRQKSDHCRFAVVIHCIKSLLPRCQKSSGIKKAPCLQRIPTYELRTKFGTWRRDILNKGWARIGFAVAAPCTNLPEGIVSGWAPIGFAAMATPRPSQYDFGHP